jgi:hypothetical protein
LLFFINCKLQDKATNYWNFSNEMHISTFYEFHIRQVVTFTFANSELKKHQIQVCRSFLAYRLKL